MKIFFSSLAVLSEDVFFIQALLTVLYASHTSKIIPFFRGQGKTSELDPAVAGFSAFGACFSIIDASKGIHRTN